WTPRSSRAPSIRDRAHAAARAKCVPALGIAGRAEFFRDLPRATALLPMTEALRPFVMCLALASCTAAPSSPGVDPPPGDDAGPTALPSAVATQIAVGGLHICALTSTGAVRCWGTSYHGEVGNGGPIDSTDYLVPVQVVGLTSGVVAISAHDGDH